MHLADRCQAGQFGTQIIIALHLLGKLAFRSTI